jgi:cell division protease FtsH
MATKGRASLKTLGRWAFLVTVFSLCFRAFSTGSTPAPMTWDQVFRAVASDDIARVDVELVDGQGSGEVTLNDGRRFSTERRPIGDFATLQASGVAVVFTERSSSLTTAALQWLPLVVIVIILVFFMRQLKGAPNKAADLLKFEPTPLAVPGPVMLTGLEEAKQALLSAAAAVREGRAGPRRVLLTGAPGTGKTALLKTLASETGLPCFVLSGAQFVEVFVGTGAARIRKLFETAAAAQPCVVAIDDVDAFAKVRSRSEQEGQVDERNATLLELLNRLDGLAPFPPKLLFLCTTSRVDLLDEALVRPGRIELRVQLEPGGQCTVTPS